VREGKEADFEAAERQWGSNVNETTKTVAHHVKKDTGEYAQYFNFRPERCLEKSYIDGEGKSLANEEVKLFEKPRKKSTRQGTDKEVVWRSYKTESIVAVAMRGCLYVVQG
jgi:hypothetical protein